MQMTLEKVVDNEVIEEQMVENQLMILISLLPGKNNKCNREPLH